MRCPLAALLIAALIAPAARACAQGAAKPAYVVQAEHNYRRARDGLKAAQGALARVQQEEARLGSRAMRLRRQWIEPAKLWQAKLAARRRLAFARQTVNQSLVALNDARDAARLARVGPLPQPEPLSTRFWWF